MNQIETAYLTHISSTTGQERVERCASLYASICEMLTLQIKREDGKLDGRAIKRRVAERLYSTDSATLELLKRAR